MTSGATEPSGATSRDRREVRGVPAGQRPIDPTPVHTEDLPANPQRDRTIAASAWSEAPEELHELGRRFGGPDGHDADSLAGTEATFVRRIGPWLLWRAGPPRHADASYWAARAEDLDVHHAFALFADGSGEGVGPSGARHTRFRAWKEDLRDD